MAVEHHGQKTEASFTDGLNAAEAEAFCALARRRSFPAGSTLFYEGDPPDDVVLVEEGQLKVSVTALDGQEVVLAVIEPGELIGELSAIDGEPHSASAVALTDCTVQIVTADRFIKFLHDFPRVQWELLVQVIVDLRRQSRRTFELGAGDALGRVCGCLAEMAARYGVSDGEAVRLESPMSQTDMAAWTGLSREAVVKALRTLRSLGVIENEGRSFVITDIDALRARADF
ncbi:MAG: Crp/Fnr family transcriptional regulator [Acidimicrobiales bacterium]